MVDREKVVEALECCLDIVKSGRWASGCISCPYAEEKNNCREKMIRDAIELLKEQEPVEPIKLENWWKCPSCSGNIVCNMKYCPGCGRKVKWE